MTENMIIMYAPGLGGNHLANLVSLGDRYCRDGKIQEYFNQDSEFFHAHFHDVNLPRDWPKLRDQNNVFTEHFFTYINTPIYHEVPNKRFTVIHWPRSQESVAMRRVRAMHGTKPWSLFLDSESFYKQQYLEKLIPAPWQTFFSDDLFQPDADLVIDKVEQSFRCQIEPRDFARKVHNTWYEKISRDL